MDKWSRKKMKEIGKTRMKANYWKAVLTAIIISFVVGSAGAVNSGAARADSSTEVSEVSEATSISHQLSEMNATGIAFFVIWTTFAVLIAFGIVIVVDAFLMNPLEIGCKRFFYLNLLEKADIKEIGYVFDKSYKNSVKIMFFMDLKVTLWTCLFIIPGIIKGYEYRLIPYLLAENTAIDKKEAFEKSRALMKGNKWRAFVFDLSFLFWNLLSVLTLGMVGIFYSNPYKGSADAAFYQAVKEENYDRI